MYAAQLSEPIQIRQSHY